MATPLRKLGLNTAIFVSFTFGLLAILSVLALVVPAQADRYLTDSLLRMGKAIAREVASKVVVSRRPFDDEASMEIERLVQDRGDEVAYVGAWSCARRNACQLEELIARRPGATNDQAIIDAFNRRAWSTDPHVLPTGELLVAYSVSPSDQSGTGWVLVTLKRERIDEGIRRLRITVLIALAIGTVLFSALVWVISRVFILRPLNSMMGMASRLSEADLTGRVDEEPTTELGSLAEALNRIAQSLRDTLGRVRGVSEGLVQVIDQISRTGTVVSSGAGTILIRVEETSSSMVEMLASLRGIAENVEALYQSAEESSSSIMEMAATNEEVADNVQSMADSVEQTAGALGQMAVTTKEVAKNVEELLASSEQTSSSMREIDLSIGQVETNANETARLSEQVSQDAETGVEALQKTLAGIDKIKESSRVASNVIEQLGRRIREIGNILNVIDDVAEQTNLLALNAAIIAAQAGEHGKGFAVVADEIKDLAERTGASTKEIAELIRGVQEESRNAVSAMNLGVRNVEEGVLLGREAETALKKIFDSANRSTMMVKAIARATVEQSRGSKQVTTAVQRIAETITQINKSTHEQARGSEQIINSAERMKVITQHVLRSSQEQSHGSKQITRSIENINEMVTHLNRAQREQTKGAEQTLAAVDTIKTVCEHQAKSVRQLEEAIDVLRRQADVLRAEVRRFRTG